ncbi:MAG: 3-hydroxybutyrate dehydrogenase [Pelagibacteraceae bacterium]|jgi:3-hydroxybutyrate dehydrogenase|nr:3-hydroxybutyrate dehydrogenase [Pelagibacteraceae bacterium]MBO6466323.1 3-hydroxybutyrate dehydrogenase [Pelagibacteraceae bacterium]MBO6468247.1 3-hydroxybutyrate dehydrogenase [Pelagibacteraceae bacterium]MBO6469525.1 3-hydroxybutyrate dehydrogenase [Pelagibacteraceae bacterium]MBO6471044.1 3-hydroxybutyrate dehydrogenase [Pelagibacteraceae bacterium]|tara:strand:- start:1972 stop:2748 length:777 start_codon:yes stop_codon:yes gene_type:complete
MKKVKNVLITGGLGGIGLNICKLFIKDHNVIIVDNKLPNKSFAKKLSDINKKNLILYKKIDLEKTSQIKNLFQQLKKKFSSIDILINCAGIQHLSSVENFSEEMWEKVISINLSSSFYTSKYAIPLMRKNKWGRIINIASTHGLVASVNKSAYVASKHGMIGLTKTIALETATSPITCNAICPGWVDTPLVSRQIEQRVKKNKTSRKKEELNLLKEKQPNLSFIKGSDIAALAYFLCTDEAKDITGSSINIDGGWTSQ